MRKQVNHVRNDRFYGRVPTLRYRKPYRAELGLARSKLTDARNLGFEQLPTKGNSFLLALSPTTTARSSSHFGLLLSPTTGLLARKSKPREWPS